MIVISAEYDSILTELALGRNVCFVPVHDGAFESIYTPADSDALVRARSQPVRFAYAACKKTRQFAREQGYEVL